MNCSNWLYRYDIYEPSLAITVLLSVLYGSISVAAVLGETLDEYLTQTLKPVAILFSSSARS